jgi:hypothetical protein
MTLCLADSIPAMEQHAMTTYSKHLGAVILCVVFSFAASARADEKFSFVDLDSHMNHDLAENLTGVGSTNSLAQLPTGEQTLGGVKFRVGPGMIQLGSRKVPAFPEKAEGIPVDHKFRKLHILQSTHYGRGKSGDGWHVDDGVQIGQYVVHYEDGSKQGIPIIYGEDVRDWYFNDGEPGPSRAKTVWKGDNEVATKIGSHLRVYLTTWTNPKPDKKVLTIDFTSDKSETLAAPFCISMSTEEK